MAYLLRRLVLPKMKNGLRALVMESEPPPPEFLLQEFDLPPMHNSFLRVTTRETFMKEFGQYPQPRKIVIGQNKVLRRLSIVLALQRVKSDGDINGNDVIPIPFIIDTGTPEFMYLGSGAVSKLKEADCLQDTAGLYPFRLSGNLCRGDESCTQPFTCALPINYEEPVIRGDVRLNLLGLAGIEYFHIMETSNFTPY